MSRLSRLLLVLGLALAGASCRAVPPAPTYPGNLAAGGLRTETEYLVTPGDRLVIRYPAYPQWNTEVVVRPDGRGSVPLVGDVQFGRRPLSEVETELEASLADRVRSPQVELAVVQLHPRQVFVGGEVEVPGLVKIEGPRLTLLESIFAAGGPLTKSATLETVILSRVDEQGVRQAWTVDAASGLVGGREPVLLLPGDVVLVPNRRIDEANLFVEQYITNMIPSSNLLSSLILLGLVN